jgi:hypothetical protein
VNRGDVILATDTDGLSDNAGCFELDHLNEMIRFKEGENLECGPVGAPFCRIYRMALKLIPHLK